MPSYYIVLEKGTPNLDVYVNGNALARDSDSLEEVAKKIGVTPLLSFFSASRAEADSLLEDQGEAVGSLGIKPPAEKWFSAEEGLNTVRELINHLEKPEPSRSNQALSNLKEFERVLDAANQSSVRWHLAIEY